MNDYQQNDSWIWQRLKQAWPILLGLTMMIVWIISQYYMITGTNLAQGDDIAEIKYKQGEEIKARQDLLQEVQSIKTDVSAIKESNKINLGLLQQIINLLNK